jgi:hypothetical protein
LERERIDDRDPSSPVNYAIDRFRAGDQDDTWRLVAVEAIVSTVPRHRLRLWLDLGSGDEREFAEHVAGTGTMTFVWINEDVSLDLVLSEERGSRWREAVDRAPGTPREVWRSELEMRKAHDSAYVWSTPPRVRKATATREPPRVAVPFFARDVRPLPDEESPLSGDLVLPPGNLAGAHAPQYWVSYTRVGRPSVLASDLAEAFPRTGLWPLGWDAPHDPDVAWREPGDVAVIDDLAMDEIAPRAWAARSLEPTAVDPFASEFPGLAAACEPGSCAWFRSLDVVEQPWDRRPGRQLMLVPCHRPADALSVIGWEGQNLRVEEVCAVLRSWEERFSAVLVELDESTVTLAVGAPPTQLDHALRVAAELAAVTRLDELWEHPRGLHGVAELLMTDTPKARRHEQMLTRSRWTLTFDE